MGTGEGGPCGLWGKWYGGRDLVEVGTREHRASCKAHRGRVWGLLKTSGGEEPYLEKRGSL